jgi:hypothetical protein
MKTAKHPRSPQTTSDIYENLICRIPLAKVLQRIRRNGEESYANASRSDSFCQQLTLTSTISYQPGQERRNHAQKYRQKCDSNICMSMTDFDYRVNRCTAISLPEYQPWPTFHSLEHDDLFSIT